MINSGMMICSFFLKKSFSRGTENVFMLNKGYEFLKEDKTIVFFADCFKMFEAFCSSHYDNMNDDKKMKTFSVERNSVKKYDDDTYRAMAFTVISGGYGVESDLTDSNTNEVLFHRDTHIADNKKFNVLLFVPKDQEETCVSKGIMIFQTIGTYGVKTFSIKKMQEFFMSIGLSLQTRSVSVKTLIEKLIEQGNMYKITLIKERVSCNDADNMLISTGLEERSYVKPKLQPLWLQKLLVFFDRMDKSGVYEIDGEEFDDIKVQFKLGDRVRTAGLRNIDKFSVVEDFPEIVFSNGRYNRTVLLNYMIETANAYKEKMIFTVNSEV